MARVGGLANAGRVCARFPFEGPTPQGVGCGGRFWFRNPHAKGLTPEREAGSGSSLRGSGCPEPIENAQPVSPAHFLTVPLNGGRPANDGSHTGTQPSDRTGRHLILAVWTINDMGNAFYQCSDVNF